MKPEEANMLFMTTPMHHEEGKNFRGQQDGYDILATVRHPRYALVTPQNFTCCSDWKNIRITKGGRTVLSIFRDKLQYM